MTTQGIKATWINANNEETHRVFENRYAARIFKSSMERACTPVTLETVFVDVKELWR